MMLACFEKSSSGGKAHAMSRQRGVGAMVLARRRRRKVNNTDSHRGPAFLVSIPLSAD